MKLTSAIAASATNLAYLIIIINVFKFGEGHEDLNQG